MRESKGKKKGIKKAGTTVISATLLGAGAAGIVFAYQSGAAFHPSGKNQDLKKNQIVFSKNKKLTGQNAKKDKDNSRFLKKDEQNKQGAQTKDNADYMFQNGMMMAQQQTQQIATKSNVQQVDNTNNSANKNNYYQVTKDPSKADITINRPNSNHDDNSNGPATTDDDSTNNSNTNNNHTNSTDHNNNNSNNTTDHDNANNNTHDDHSDNNKDNNTEKDDNNKDQDSKPTKRPSDSAKDPTSEKEFPNNTIVPMRPFVDNVDPFFDDNEDGDNDSVVVMQSDTNLNAILYKGQSISQKDIYNSLDTYVRGKDKNMYVWDDSAYDKFIKIEAVSFDGGETWKDEFPTQIPMDLQTGQMKIKINYRFTEKKENWVTRVVDYEPKNSRVFVLSQQINEENTVITDDILLNKYNQNPEPETAMNLLGLQSGFLGSDRLTALFPGWTEKGELVPWFYKVSAGRHILEPADMVPLDDKYIVRVKNFWMTQDCKIDSNASILGYLQTLTDMNEAIAISWGDDDWTGGNLYEKITVPKYVQAIDIDSGADLSVNHLEIPDTVLYVKMDDSGMRVNESFKVDKDNPNYMSTEDGLLMTKDQKEIIGIPYNTKKIKIAESVDRVRIEDKNQLSEIDLSAKKIDQIPKVDYTKLKNCKIILNDDVMIPYIQQNYRDVFTNNGNTVAAASDSDQTYTVESGMIINKDGRIIMILQKDLNALNFTDHMTAVAADAFDGLENIKTLVMPISGKKVSFEENSLRGSSIQTIRCYTKEQYDQIVEQLEAAKAPEGLEVQMINTSKEGYKYCMQATDKGEEVLLISTPKDLTEFDGTLTTMDQEKIAITQISNNAFEECRNLKWVTLPESVKKIGYQAFKNCVSLEGMLIESKDEITIGDQSFDGCSSLRFIGSNAKKGIMENDYEPVITDSYANNADQHRFFYVPGDCEGYNEACTSVSSGSDTPLSGYSMEDIGGGAKMLYGVNDKGDPWLAMRSGKTVADKVKLPKTTKEIFNYAMADTSSESGEYQLNFDELDMWSIDARAFYKSGVGGDIVFNKDIWLFDESMSECKNITSVEIPGDAIYLGSYVFVRCDKLKTAHIGKLSSVGSLDSGLFDGCNQLTDITLDSSTAEKLQLNGSSGYQFNYQWTQEEESKNLRIHIPNGSEKNFIKGWRYAFAGCVKRDEDTVYQAMRNKIFDDYLWDYFEVLTEEQIDAIQKEELLKSENILRNLFGMDEVTEPTELYLYHNEQSTGMLTLVDVPSVTTTLDLGTVDLEMPEGWYLDYIGTGTFQNAKNLAQLTIPDTMSGIENNAFKGVESDKLDLYFEGKTPLKLMIPDAEDNTDSEQARPYEFGVSDEKLRLHVPEGSENDYLKSWSLALVGYDNLDSMQWAVTMELMDNNMDNDLPEDSEINEAVAKKLLPIENRLRKMMGMEEIHSIYELCYKDELELQEPSKEQKKEATTEKPKENQAADTEQKIEESEETKTEDSHEETKQITIPETMTKMDANLYFGEKSSYLELNFEGKTPLKLQIKEEGTPFSFGKEDDKIKIHVPEDCKEAYLEQWKYAMAGYEDLESMKKAIREENKGEQLTEDQVEEIISQKLLLGENRLRKMMEMEELKK